MRNLLIALAAVGTLTVSSLACAQSPDQYAVYSPDQVIVEGVQSDVAMPTPMDDHQVVENATDAQPIEYRETTQDQSVMVDQPMMVQQHQPARVRYRSRSTQNQSVFSKLMEMERKKNAWLKRTFLGK